MLRVILLGLALLYRYYPLTFQNILNHSLLLLMQFFLCSYFVIEKFIIVISCVRNKVLLTYLLTYLLRAQPSFTKQQYKLQIKEKWNFSFVIKVKQLLNRQYTKIELSQKQYQENFKITNHVYRFLILKIIVIIVLNCYLVKLLSNH